MAKVCNFFRYHPNAIPEGSEFDATLGNRFYLSLEILETGHLDLLVKMTGRQPTCPLWLCLLLLLSVRGERSVPFLPPAALSTLLLSVEKRRCG
jgi:hypothetical protein